ncbi:MAG: hypothetical protein MI802_27400 [Desulfobacterales bacterium]|nr:hypothetical protein [Desulfobacterales bacterium]
MKRFRVVLNGQNFDMGNGNVLGFITTRWVKAINSKLAEQVAVQLIQEDESIQSNIHNAVDDPPMIYVENMIEVGWFEFFTKSPGSGYTFYKDEKD